MTDEPAISLPDRLRALVSYLQELESPAFEFGRWEQPVSPEPGVSVMPYTILSPVASSLIQAAYDRGWVMRTFDWPAWQSTLEAIQLRDDPDALKQATPEQLARLLTVLIRKDRFVDGMLLDAFDSGLLVRILRRAAVHEAQTTSTIV